MIRSIELKLDRIKQLLREPDLRSEVVTELREAYADALLLEFLERERMARSEMDRAVRARMAAALQTDAPLQSSTMRENPGTENPGAQNTGTQNLGSQNPSEQDPGFGVHSPEVVIVPIPQGPPPHFSARDTEAERFSERPSPPAKPKPELPSEAAPHRAVEDEKAVVESPKNAVPTVWEMGLNDRIALTKHLFAGSAEDYHRAISQLATFATSSEAKRFVEEQLRPESDWTSSDAQEQLERLHELIQARFGG